MLNRNNFLPGLLIGLLLPLVCWTMLYQIFSLLEVKGAASGAGLASNFRERTLAIVALAINILPMKTYQGRRWEDSMRGVVVATSILALAWVLLYGVTLF